MSRGWRDDRQGSYKNAEIVTDREGVPQWDGEDMSLLKQYKSRVMVERASDVGTSDIVKEKHQTLGLRLTRGLTVKAWRAVEPLLADLSKLTADGGPDLVIKALEGLDKEEVIRKQFKFDDFFKRSSRRHGEEMAEYIRDKRKKFLELTDMDSATALSSDLYAYFPLEGARLRDEDKRMVCMVAQNEFNTANFEKTLKTNFHDIHVRDRRTPYDPGKGGDKTNGRFGRDGDRKRPHDRAHAAADEEATSDEPSEEPEDAEVASEEDDLPSDAGASQDDEVNNAYASYDTARSKLRDTQKRQGLRPRARSPSRSGIRPPRRRRRRRSAARVARWAIGLGTMSVPSAARRSEPIPRGSRAERAVLRRGAGETQPPCS